METFSFNPKLDKLIILDMVGSTTPLFNPNLGSEFKGMQTPHQTQNFDNTVSMGPNPYHNALGQDFVGI